ncbi:MAG: tryptophan synthase subunit alpha [Oscillospiraceae bacterium]
MEFELICYLNFGYPTIKEGIKAAQTYIKCGCKTLQLDIPSRNPYLEHQNVQDRMKYCLEHTPDYQDYFDGISEIHVMYPNVKLVFMLYENVVEELGVKRVADFCNANNIHLSTYVGTNEKIKKELIENGLNIACYVQYHLPDDEVKFALESNTPTLLQARSVGKTREGYETFKKALLYLRKSGITKPICASVGIKTPQDIREVKNAGADGAFVGSALMNVIHDEKLLEKTIQQFAEAANA